MAAPLPGEYRAYGLGDDDKIVIMFEARYGYKPADIYIHGPIKLAGPIRPGTKLEPGESVQVGGACDD